MNIDNFGLHLERFLHVGLQLTREVLAEKNSFIKQLCSNKLEHSVFGNILARDKYQKNMKLFIFKEYCSLSEGRQADKFC